MARLTGIGFFAAAVSFVDRFRSSLQTSFDPSMIDPADSNPALSRNLDAIEISGSCGTGRGSAVLTCKGSELTGIVNALSAFDSNISLEELSPSDVIRRTIYFAKEEGEIRFKTSFAKHSREIAIPAKEYDAFVECLGMLDDQVESVLAKYIETAQEQNAEAAKDSDSVPATE